MTSPTDRRKAKPDAGFTLLEMMVTLAVVGLALGLVAGGKPVNRTLTGKAAAAALTSSLREARARAIAQDRPVRLVIDIAAHRFRIDGGPVRSLPADFALSVTTDLGDSLDADRAGIRFSPDGSSSGGSILLGSGKDARIVRVDRFTGRIRLGDGR